MTNPVPVAISSVTPISRPPWCGRTRHASRLTSASHQEGGELCILNGDNRSEVRVSDVAVETRIGSRDLNIESSYEYGARVGYWCLLKAFNDRGLKATVNLVGLAGEQNPQALRAMIDSGFDLQPHGWRWIDFDSVDEDTEREFIRRSIEQVCELTGSPPLGYYVGMPSLNTRRLVVETGSFVYDSDVYNDDLPYWSADYPGLLLVPYSLDTNDSTFGRAEHDYQLGDEFFTYLKDSFDTLYGEGESHPGMMTVGLHARLLGRIGSLHKFLDYLQRHQKVWICRRDDLAKYWAEHYPNPVPGKGSTP
jgi:allantoinase